MTTFHIHGAALALAIALCACGAVETPADTFGDTSTTEQAGMNLQGMNLQGMNLQGMNLQGMNLQGINLGGATLSGDTLHNVRVERGEVVAERGATTLRGAALVGAHLLAQVRDTSVDPPATATVEYRIAAVDPEDSQNDPTHTGNTFLYTIEQWVADSGAWQPGCSADADGRHVAIPVAAIWNEHGDRIASTTQFTFGCTTGVIAKCYRWGYRPWVTGYGDLTAMHQTCTRLARADYCGNGTPHTHDGTKVNVWDTLSGPGPIQRHASLVAAAGMVFEAGWNTGGAVCLSHARWMLDDGAALAALCPDRLLLPGVGQAACDSPVDALLFDSSTKLFNESYLNPISL